MSLRIQAPQAAPAKAGESKAKDDAAKAGRDFEAILVRQMLSQTKIAGKGGYGDMAVEALATAVTSAGGLGMGRAIEDALGDHREPVPRESRGLSPHTSHPAHPPSAPTKK